MTRCVKCVGPSVHCRAHWLVYLVMSTAEHVNIVLTCQTFKKFLQKEKSALFHKALLMKAGSVSSAGNPSKCRDCITRQFYYGPFSSSGLKSSFFFFLSFFKHLFKGGEEKYILIHPNWFLLQNACDCEPLITSECQPPRTFCFLISNGSFQRLALDCGDFQSIRPSLPNLIQVPSQA